MTFRCGCEPENENATPEIATAMTGGAVSGVAFVFSGGRKRKCNDGRPEGEFFFNGSVVVSTLLSMCAERGGVRPQDVAATAAIVSPYCHGPLPILPLPRLPAPDT